MRIEAKSCMTGYSDMLVELYEYDENNYLVMMNGVADFLIDARKLKEYEKAITKY